LGADVVIATPGRFISHITMGNVDMSKVSFFVLDEADRMLDMGFSEDILSIAKKSCQRHVRPIMFSATMPTKIEQVGTIDIAEIIPSKMKLAVSKPAEKITAECIHLL
jgi:ATP-dependent RNA helicase RhlE